MDLLTIERINLLHPKIRKQVLEAYQDINNNFLGKGIRLRFSHTYRTFEEQNKLYCQGRSTPGKIITNAKSGFSNHNYGLAFDIVLLIDKNLDGIFEAVSWDTEADYDNDGIPDWREITQYFKQMGFVWGGDWKSFPDYPHFEKTFELSTKQLLNKYKNGDTFDEIINGKTYKWVKI